MSAISPDQVLHAAPLRGAANPSTTAAGTSPGSFANAAQIGGPLAFSSPDTPGMPAPSALTAWDFLPEGWSIEAVASHAIGCAGHSCVAIGAFIRAVAPRGFVAITQLESARLGIVTPQMVRVAEREGHLTTLQVRDEIAAGRMVIPANRVHGLLVVRSSNTRIPEEWRFLANDR